LWSFIYGYLEYIAFISFSIILLSDRLALIPNYMQIVETFLVFNFTINLKSWKIIFSEDFHHKFKYLILSILIFALFKQLMSVTHIINVYYLLYNYLWLRLKKFILISTKF